MFSLKTATGGTEHAEYSQSILKRGSTYWNQVQDCLRRSFLWTVNHPRAMGDQLPGKSSARRLAGWSMRRRITSSRYSLGLIPRALQVCIIDKMIAAAFPPPSLPTNSQFFRPIAIQGPTCKLVLSFLSLGLASREVFHQ